MGVRVPGPRVTRFAIAGAVVLVASLWWIGTARVPEPSISESAPGHAPGPYRESTDAAQGGPESAPPPLPGSDRTLQTDAFQVVGSDGRPLGQARAALVIVRDEGMPAAWPWIDPVDIDLRTRMLEVDGEGRFTLEPRDAGAQHAEVLWVEHVGHVVRSFFVPAGSTRTDVPRLIVLAPGGRIDVRVVDPSGAPVPGALLHQRHELRLAERSALAAADLTSRLQFWRTARCDGQGRVSLSDLGTRQVLDARSPTGRSAAWNGRAPAEVTLEIRPTASCSGRVLAPPEILASGRCLVRALAILGGGEQRLATVEVPVDGIVPPFEVPVLEAVSYGFEVSGAGIVPARALHAVPLPGADLAFEVSAERGTSFPLVVRDPEGEPVPGAQASWAWQSGESWLWVDAITDSAGRCSVDTLPAGWLWLGVEKSGYQAFQQQLMHSGTFEPAYEVRLQRGGNLRGTVVADGVPVRSFTIATRPIAAGVAPRTTLHDLEGGEDGSFEIAGLPPGDMEVFAFSPDRPRTAAQRVSITAEESARVELHLLQGDEARGRVIDASTNEPVGGATVRFWASSEAARLRPWGPAARTEPDGTFRLAGASPGGPQGIEALAAGYASAHVQLGPSKSRVVDVGVLALTRPRSIEIRVLCDQDREIGALTAALAGRSPAAAKRFDAQGKVVFEDRPPGDFGLRLDHGSDWWMERWFELGAATAGGFDVDLRRQREQVVRVVAGAGTSLPEASIVRARYVDTHSGRPTLWQAWVPASRQIDVGFLSGAHVAFEVVGPDGVTLGSRLVAPAEDGDLVDIVLDGDGASLRVVDRTGEPVVGAFVQVHRHPGFAERVLESDGAGIARLAAFPRDEVDVLLHHPAHGFGLHRRVRLGLEPVELEIAPTGVVMLALVDDGVPLRGVQVALLESRTFGHLMEEAVSGEDGRVRAEGFPVGEYECVVDHPGIWPTRVPIHAMAGTGLEVVSLRRVGSAVLRATRAGSPQGGLPILVRSISDAIGVETWCASGLVRRTPEHGRTDPDGLLRLDGLPRGSYAWAAPSESGDTVEGTFEVLASQRVDAHVLLP